MAQKRRGGFKAPGNYEPGRGSKPKSRFRSDSGSKDAGERGRDGAKGRDSSRGRDGAKGRDTAAGRGDSRGRDGVNQRDNNRGRDGGYSRDAGNGRDAGRSRDGAGSRDAARARDHFAARQERDARAPKAAPKQTLVFEKLDAVRTTAADVEGMTFEDLGLGGNIVRTLGELGAKAPFPIQAATIPDTLRGRDVLGRARTGSGKTIAFGAAIVERMLMLKAQGAFGAPTPKGQPKPARGERVIKRPTRKPKVLILAPTRELALQIDRTVQPIARSVGFYTAQFVGGVPIEPQLHALERGIDIVIGTPGRVQDLVFRKKLDLREVVITVLDEADHMCDLGFLEQVQEILRLTERGGQRLLFSATLDAGVSELVTEFLRKPAVHEAEGSELSAADSTHRVLIVKKENKDQVLTELARRRGRTMLFCRTRAGAERIVEMLGEAGIKATALHGNLSQARRELNLAKFAEGRSPVLVATDVAARGIHVDNVDLVIQADPPVDHKTYTHRAGRTGRAGSTGLVLTVVPPTRQKHMREMLELAEIKPASFDDFVPGQKLPK